MTPDVTPEESDFDKRMQRRRDMRKWFLLAFMTVKLLLVTGLFLTGKAHAETLAPDRTLRDTAIILSPPTTESIGGQIIRVNESAPVPPRKDPVDYEADSVSFDQTQKIITLKGQVILRQDGRTLEADTVVYNLTNDSAEAEGHVIVTDQNGDVHRAERVTLTDRMSRGLIDQLRTTLRDESRIWAAEGEKLSDTHYQFREAVYTACKPCRTNPEKRPPWQLHAERVDIRRDEQRVVYHNAWLDVGGVPVLYTPYFSHPDGTVEQKSGFLTPNFGWNSNLGGFYDQPYYWAISPSQDATISVMPTTKQGPMLKGQYRQRLDQAAIELSGSVTHSSRTDSVNNRAVPRDDELRGHLFADARWDINSLWRAGADLELTSDEQYLRQYDFSSKSVLENRLYAERFEGRDYANVEFMGFQDVRVGSAKTDQPNIWPSAQWSMLGKPGDTLGGRWAWDNSFLSLSRDGNGQDVWRATSDLGWQRRDIAPIGVLLTSDLGLRGDLYYTSNRIEARQNPSEDGSKQESRFLPSAQLTASYPMQAIHDLGQVRVEPLATIYAASDSDNDNSIPNEDSQDVQLSASNLLRGNRFPGMDRVEDETHVAYGVRSGLYGPDGDSISGFVGQSYAFDEDETTFPDGSGLETASSDYVGSFSLNLDEGRKTLTYQVQMDSHTLTSQRHEFFGQAKEGPVEVYGHYLYAKGVEGTQYQTSREQIKLGSVYSLDEMWRVRGEGTYDLSSQQDERGLRRAIAGVDYIHDCYNLSLTADRQIADESSGAQETTIMFRIGLKNLGEYEAQPVTLRDSQEP